MANDWTKAEVEEIVDTYFSMLTKELAGEPYNKAKHNRELMPKLNNRSKASVEFKHRNISTVLSDHGYQFIKGYLPAKNKQGLLEKVVLSRLHVTFEYPQTHRSWTLLSPTVAIKRMDKSSFRYQGSGIPRDFSFFFDASAKDGQKSITLIHQGKKYPALIQPDPPEQRVRLFWKNGLDQKIEEYFPNELAAYQADQVVGNPPELRFSRTSQLGEYKVDFIASEYVDKELPVIPEDIQPLPEGARELKTINAPKRNPINRRQAIQYHGLDCAVCGFNFENEYGELGKGFIEVHHITELGEIKEETLIDPRTDLIPLCSNCHRMIHKNGGLSVDSLREIIDKEEKP